MSTCTENGDQVTTSCTHPSGRQLHTGVHACEHGVRTSITVPALFSHLVGRYTYEHMHSENGDQFYSTNCTHPFGRQWHKEAHAQLSWGPGSGHQNTGRPGG